MKKKPIKKSRLLTPPSGKNKAVIRDPMNIPARQEKTIEQLNGFLTSIAKGNDCDPFILGIVDGKPMVEKLIRKKDGTFVLPQLGYLSDEDVKKKNKVVKAILKKIEPTLIADIGKVTYVALMRKDAEDLRQIVEGLAKNKDIKLKNKAGCIYLCIGDKEMVI